MLDTLWQVFLGSIIALAIVLVWIVIVAFVVAAVRQARKMLGR